VKHSVWLLFFALVACEGDGIGVAIPLSVFQPTKLIFGPSDIGETHELNVVVTNNADRLLGVIEVEFTDEGNTVFSARLADGGTLKGAALPKNQSVSVRVLFQPIEPIDYETTLRLHTEDRVFELEVRGSGRDVINSDLILTPNAIDFSGVAIGTTHTYEIEVQNLSRTAQSITEVRLLSSRRAVQEDQSTFWISELDSNVAITNRSIGARGTIKLHAHFRPRSIGPRMETLQLMTINKGHATLAVSGTGSSGGRLVCAPESLAFGDVKRGSASDLFSECEVKDGVYRIASVAFEQGTDSNFSAVAFPEMGTAFQAGEKFDVTVRFTGSGLASNQTGAVLINGTHNTQSRIELSGNVIPTAKDETALTVHLEWDTPGTDFDLHLVREGGAAFESLNDCYFREKNPDWGQTGWSLDDPFLDRDDINSGGPEEINLAVAGESRYQVFVHFYGTEAFVPTAATARIEFYGQTALTESRLFNQCGEMWHVAELTGVGAIAQATSVGTSMDLSAAGMCP